MIVLVLLAGVCLGTIAAKLQAAKRQRQAVEAIRNLNRMEMYAGAPCVASYSHDLAQPPRHEWLRNWLGDDFFDQVTQVALTRQGDVTDADMTCFASLPDLETVSIDHLPLTDSGVRHLSGLAKLRQLRLCEVPITDSALDALSRLPSLSDISLDRTRVGDRSLLFLGRMKSLRSLNLKWTRVTDSGLRHLVGLLRLEDLDLACTQITDSSIEHLRRLANLKTLSLGATQVTREGFESIKKTLPACSVTWWPKREFGASSGGPDIPEPDFSPLPSGQEN
jgi:hypothetical protein